MMKLIHITDLYHPHNDPDDHFDLAQVFALAKCGYFSLEQVIIDWTTHPVYGDPALCAVAQMNRITGLNVPVSIGADTDLLGEKPELWADAPVPQVQAAERILSILRESSDPVCITIAGGALDTAIALARGPELFREKCAGIILNSGSATNTGYINYNVALGRRAYAALFDAPCPLFWAPCYDDHDTGKGRHQTFWSFRMNEVLDAVRPPVQAFFLYMLTRSEDPRYLRYLTKPVDEEALCAFGKKERHMWCTGTIFNAAGLTVDPAGRILPEAGCPDPVYRYEPVTVRCDEDGVTHWQPKGPDGAEAPGPRFIFAVTDEERYAAAMTAALAALLKKL